MQDIGFDITMLPVAMVIVAALASAGYLIGFGACAIGLALLRLIRGK